MATVLVAEVALRVVLAFTVGPDLLTHGSWPGAGEAVAGELEHFQLEFDPRVALGVVMAAGGYPVEYAKGDVISGLDKRLVDVMELVTGSAAVRDPSRIVDPFKGKSDRGQGSDNDKGKYRCPQQLGS